MRIEKIMVARWEMRPNFQVLMLYTVIYSTQVRSCKLERLALVQILTYSRNYKLDSYTAYTSDIYDIYIMHKLYNGSVYSVRGKARKTCARFNQFVLGGMLISLTNARINMFDIFLSYRTHSQTHTYRDTNSDTTKTS
jgi:hypothetical protein